MVRSMKNEELVQLRKNANKFHKQYLADGLDKEDERLMELRSAFVEKYDEEYLANELTKKNYSLGDGKKDTFSYKIEFELARLGSARGGTAEKLLFTTATKGGGPINPGISRELSMRPFRALKKIC